MGSVKDISGNTYANILVISFHSIGRNRDAHWTCRCHCGNEFVTSGGYLRSGGTTSCGCKRTKNTILSNTKHGMSATPEYRAWIDMHKRCSDPKLPKYMHYGGRGIRVCERWNSLENFILDMGERPHEMSLERIDNNKGYEPDNCCWATHSQQCRNTRRTKLDGKKVVLLKLLLAQGSKIKKIADVFGISDRYVYSIACGKYWSDIKVQIPS